MAENYEVRQGESVSSIAFEHGFFWETLWDHAQNANLKTQRNDPDVLLPGDILFIPDKQPKEEAGQTEKRHRFRLKGVPAKFVLQLLDGGQPRAGVDYILAIDGELCSGTTDAEGKLQCWIPPNAKNGKLIVDGTEEYELALAGIDPVTEQSGVAARLANLGLLAAAEAVGEEELRAAISEFQKQHNLAVSGQCDEPTRKKLLAIHGC